MRRFLTYYLLFISVLIHAQPGTDIKVGLVLSGGGAKGLAHIGVLQALDSIGLYPDIVTGTSVGSIMGGLYASGYSGKEIEELARKMDWEIILSNQIPLREVAFEEKEYYGRYIAELPIINGSPQLPRGLIEGQQLHEMLSTLTQPVHEINDFDKLPIPFRAVSTDIETGEVVVLGEGSLPTAIRASMAIPSVFTPVDLDGRLLVDGGLVRNFPVEEAIAMGADIVIGVFVSTDLSKREDLNTLVDILMQSSWVMSAYDSREQRKLVDVYIEPELDQFQVMEFEQAGGMIDSGKRSGTAYAETFQAIYDSLTERGKQFKKPEKKPNYRVISVNDVQVKGNEKISSELIEEKLGIEKDSGILVEELERKIGRVYGTQYFSKINYEILGDPLGSDLVINVTESPKNALKSALHYNSESGLGLNVNFTSRNQIWSGSRFIAEVDIAENPQVDISLLKYTGVKHDFALTGGYGFNDFEIPIIDNQESVATFQYSRNNLFLRFQTTKSPLRSFGFQFNWFGSQFRPKVGDNLRSIEEGSEQSLELGLFWEYNDLNKPFFTQRGTKASVKTGFVFNNQIELTLTQEDSATRAIAEALFGERFQYISGSWKQYFQLNKRFTFSVESALRYTTSNQIGPNYFRGTGGFFNNYPTSDPFWGADFYEFLLASYFRADIGFQWEMVTDIYLIGKLNYLDQEHPMTWWDSGYEVLDLRNQPNILGGGIAIGYDSAIGPILLTLGKAGGSNTWFGGFNLGFWY